MKINDLKIEYLPIDQIKPYENNAKIHTQEQIEQIKKSILEFGMNDPIGIWRKENIIVEGHGRLLACKELGMEKIPVIRLDNLTEKQRKAYTLIHNQTTLNSDFDYNILGLELAEISDINMQEFGFDEIEANEDDFGVDFELNNSEAPKVRTIHLISSEKQKENMDKCIDFLDIQNKIDDNGISNKYGNAIYQIVTEWRQDQWK